MSNFVRTCAHPYCAEPMSRGQVVCKTEHWKIVPDSFRKRLKAARAADRLNQNDDAVEEVVKDLREHFRINMIGDNDVVECRYCGARVVWVMDRYGKRFPVNEQGVEPHHTEFSPRDHTKHIRTCPKADEIIAAAKNRKR